MAKITIDNLEKEIKNRPSVQDDVAASYYVYKIDDVPYFQIDTYGRGTRKFQAKCSQTFQIDRKNAVSLISLMMKELNITIDDLIRAER